MSSVQTNACRGNILIIDDTPVNLQLLSQMLEELGYEVRCAKSGALALVAVETEHPDLILLDIGMPDMNGYEVCEALKADPRTREIPIVFLSALNQTIDKVKAFRLGGVDYITKPFQLEEVMARIENQLQLRRLQIELQDARLEALKALAQEQELNRLRSEFVSMVSHDFRTPLTTIQGFVELLRCSGQVPSLEVVNRYVDKINRAIDHLLHLLDDILVVGSIDASISCQVATIDLARFCRDLVDTLQASVGSQHRIQFLCPVDALETEVDTTLFQQILTNLLSNAIKYSYPDSQIDVALDCQNEWVILQVRDQGIGIPPESQPHLFETFYRSKNVGEIKGNGLGLAVVKRCVELHRGTIALESEEGRGTTVTVKLPRQFQDLQLDLA